MAHYVYILRSLTDGRLYVGETADVHRRLWRHNQGLVRSTKHRRPLELVAAKKVRDRSVARELEKHLKSLAGSGLKAEMVQQGRIDV